MSLSLHIPSHPCARLVLHRIPPSIKHLPVRARARVCVYVQVVLKKKTRMQSIAKKLNKAYNDEATANSDEAEDRAINQVYKYRKEFQSKAKFYKDATAKKARADANKAVPPKQRERG